MILNPLHAANAPPSLWGRAWPSLAFAAVTLLIRLPLFGPLTIHMDEHTFLVMGQDVARGHLPYLHLWDNKPPLIFFLTAVVSTVAQHEIWVVRLVAALFDVASALLVKRLADRLFGASAIHWLCALWCVAAFTASTAGGALMSETMALPFLMGGALLLCAEKPTLRQGFVAGVLLGAAALIRLTPALPAVVVVFLILGIALLRRDLGLLRFAMATVSGGLFTLLAVAAPYAVAGELDMLLRSALLAPLAYVQGSPQESLIEILLRQPPAKVVSLPLIAGIAGFAYQVLRGKTTPGFWLFAAIGAAQLIAILQGPPWKHYLAMMFPFACVFAAPLIARALAFPRSRVITLLLAAVLAMPVPVAFKRAWARAQERDIAAETYRLLADRMAPSDTLYATVDYALYWLLDRTPPHPIVTHARNIARDFMFRTLPYGLRTGGEVMRAALATRPTWIVFCRDCEETKWYAPDTEIGRVLAPILARDYELQPSPAGRAIFRLRDAPAGAAQSKP